MMAIARSISLRRRKGLAWLCIDVEVKLQVLIVQGDADVQTKELDAKCLFEGMARGRLCVIEAMTHTLKTHVPSEPMATYLQPDLPLHPKLVPEILDFIAANQATS